MDTSLCSVVKVDTFVQGLWQVYSKVREEGFAQVCVDIIVFHFCCCKCGRPFDLIFHSLYSS